MSHCHAVQPDVQAETATFLAYFDALVDPRQPGKVIYRLQEVLLLSLLETLAGAETFVDIALFGRKKRDLLRRFLPFTSGTPSHDHLGDQLPHWIRNSFSVALPPGWRPSPVCPKACSPLTARPRGGPRRAARRCYASFRPLPPASAWCWANQGR